VKGWRKWRHEEIELLKILREDGYATAEIARQLGRTEQAVTRRIARDDIPLGESPRHSRPGAGRRVVDREAYDNALRDRSLGNVEIASRFDVSRSAVLYARRRRGIRVGRQ